MNYFIEDLPKNRPRNMIIIKVLPVFPAYTLSLLHSHPIFVYIFDFSSTIIYNLFYIKGFILGKNVENVINSDSMEMRKIKRIFKNQ